ncbi:MAG: hypothetical protein JXK04_02145 [Campylobacterales bacterium]|nr:hypothetical protein [Campylobacterales bacterium]
MAPLDTLDRLLEHVIEVESEMIVLSAQAHRRISEWIGASGAEVTDEVLEALQYQDILSQQLGATTEAIKGMRELLPKNGENAEALAGMDAKLLGILETARSKHAAFSGRVDQDDGEGIEFF